MDRQLPAHPRLADGLEVVAGAGELLQLRGCNPPLRLTGRMPQLLLPLLDGLHSLDAITEALTEWPTEQVLAAIRALAERGLIVEATQAWAASTAPAGAARTQAAFYWSASSGPADRGDRARDTLKAAGLHLFGWGSLWEELLRNLRACGADGLVAAEWPPTVSADPLNQFVPPRTNLVVLALPRHAPTLLTTVNSACLEHGVPFLPVVISGHEAVIGPTVLPGRSACYDCFKQRVKTNAAFPEDDEAYDAHLDGGSGGLTLPEWPPFTAAIAALAAMEAIRFITRFTPPITAGQVLFVDALAGTHRAGRVWKVPRCPSCTRARRTGWGGGADERADGP